MKYFIYILIAFFSITLYSRDFTFKSMGKTVRNEVTKFPDGSKFISFRHEGGFETDMAKYGIYKCHGSILYNKESSLENMHFACKFKYQTGDIFIGMGKRLKGSDINRTFSRSSFFLGDI